MRNFVKHGVTFDEATTAFGDPFSLAVPDRAHSHVEERCVLIGQSHRRRLVVVVHTETDDTVRVIHAREANRRERERYEEGTASW
jgi:uncharacterized DUF497 family protein